MSSVKPALKLGQTQHLTLTPQLRQSIRLLALSTAELELELSEAAEANPLLEYLAPGQVAADAEPANRDAQEDGGRGDDERLGPAGPDADDPFAGEPGADANANDSFADSGLDPVSEFDYSPGDSDGEYFQSAGEGDFGESDSAAESRESADWTDASIAGGSRADAGDSSWEERLVATSGLAEHLAAQVALLPLSPRDCVIAAVIVDALDDNGMLRASDEELIAACGLSPEVSPAEVEGVRHRLQRLDPTGIASRTLIECLDLQLQEQAISKGDGIADPAAIDLTRRLLERAGEIGKIPSERLARQLRCDTQSLDAALARLRRLDPRPGLRFNVARVDYVQPDVVAFRQGGRWHVRLNVAAHPGLALNAQYARMAQSASGATERYLRGRLQEARWLIRSLSARGDTLLRVAGWIVRQQSSFLDFGAEAMRPLTLREVGAALELHESTVSRATARKYLATPRGVFELRHFFSAALETETGGTASALAVQALIRKLIEAENPRHPHSDAALAKLLNGEGIAVARRTVAKYREGMRIPSSSERCRHA